MPKDQNTSEIKKSTEPQYWMEQLQQFNFFGMKIPEHMHKGLAHYIAEGRPPGDFLRALLQNDLYLSMTRADNKNLWKIPAFVGFLHNYAPAACWGDRDSVAQWCQQRGLKGWDQKRKNNGGE